MGKGWAGVHLAGVRVPGGREQLRVVDDARPGRHTPVRGRVARCPRARSARGEGLASDVDNNDDRYMSVEAGTYSDDKDGKGIELHVDFERGRDAVSTTGKFTSDSEAKKSTSDEKVAKKIEEQVDSEGDSDAVSTYSNRYRN